MSTEASPAAPSPLDAYLAREFHAFDVRMSRSLGQRIRHAKDDMHDLAVDALALIDLHHGFNQTVTINGSGCARHDDNVR